MSTESGDLQRCLVVTSIFRLYEAFVCNELFFRVLVHARACVRSCFYLWCVCVRARARVI